jgi:1-deoxy-D-xylulose-5-phosphate reductoisomerase
VKNVVILGCTGSIGENALRVVEALPGRFRVVGLAAHRNAARVLEQAARHGVSRVALSDPAAAEEARAMALAGVRVLAGLEGVVELAALADAELVVCAIVGLAALHPVLAAIEAGHDVALATKEVLVSAGELVCRRCDARGVRLLPIDSEHSALFQSMQDTRRLPWCVRRGRHDEELCIERTVRRLVLTASGGPFAQRPDLDFATVTVDDALNHPRWRMGPKVTIDSATMMNKGLEILEARWLFNVPVDRIDVVVHPESIVHSLVEFEDAAMMAQLGMPDMRIAIQYALTWPERPANATLPRLDLPALGAMTFKAPDPRRFPCLGLARAAAHAGGAAPAILNAANEEAVAAFLARRIPFPGIWRTVETVLERRPQAACATLADVVEADAWARAEARAVMARS